MLAVRAAWPPLCSRRSRKAVGRDQQSAGRCSVLGAGHEAEHLKLSICHLLVGGWYQLVIFGFYFSFLGIYFKHVCGQEGKKQ